VKTLIVTVLVASLVGVACKPTPPPIDPCASDLDGDGLVTVSDVNGILRAVHDGSTNLSFDVNQDGRVSLNDATGALSVLGAKCFE
jgi:hypothetical protein